MCMITKEENTSNLIRKEIESLKVGAKYIDSFLADSSVLL